MPIRFRCVYCDKLLGISRRKAGAVVGCPKCGEKLVVPAPGPGDGEDLADERPSPTPRAAGSDAQAGTVFERSDFDELLQPEPTVRTPEPMPLPPPPPRSSRGRDPFQAPLDLPPTSGPDELAPTPLPLGPSAPVPPAGILLSPTRATWLSVGVVLLCALFFGAGILVGRFLRPG